MRADNQKRCRICQTRLRGFDAVRLSVEQAERVRKEQSSEEK